MNLLHFADILCLTTASESDHNSIMWMSFWLVEFTRKVSINKVEVHNFQIHIWNLIKHLALPLCISISVWSYKFCCEILKFF